MNSDQDSVEEPIPLKYAKASDISTEVFLAAARAVGHNAVYLYEIAWQLSDFGVPDKLQRAPDVSEYAVQQKARQLALRKVITEGKQADQYLIPPAAEG